MATSRASSNPRPGLWLRMAVSTGNVVQLAVLVAGALLLYLAASTQAAGAVRVVLMLMDFLMIYNCCYAIAHWAVGRSSGYPVPRPWP